MHGFKNQTGGKNEFVSSSLFLPIFNWFFSGLTGFSGFYLVFGLFSNRIALRFSVQLVGPVGPSHSNRRGGCGVCGDRHGGGSGLVGIGVVVSLDRRGSTWWRVLVCGDQRGGGCGIVEIGMEEGLEQWTSAFVVEP